MFAERQDGLDSRDLDRLSRNNYREVSKRYKKAFVIKHKKFPNKIVELRAASPCHAASLVGWRPRHIKLIEVKDVEDDLADDNGCDEERES